MAAMAGISEGEVAVYDRQLRLWGVQAQQRLLKSKVLIWGLDGCNVEACKNIVLAGVSLTVRDHRAVGHSDVAFDYFLRDEDLGRNRAECAAARFQEMNPLCTVTASAAELTERDAPGLRKALKGFDVVCVSLGILGWDVELACAVDDLCREVGASFFLSMSAGEMVFFFSDLQEHTVEEHTPIQGAPEGTKRPAETLRFPSLRDWLTCTVARLEQDPGPRGIDPAFVLIRAFVAFLQEDGKPLDDAAATRFESFCRKNLRAAHQVPGGDCLADAYQRFLMEPLMHVASVAGGLLAQEVIKGITKRDMPLLNSVIFNARASVALVEELPPPERPAKKLKAAEEHDEIL